VIDRQEPRYVCDPVRHGLARTHPLAVPAVAVLEVRNAFGPDVRADGRTLITLCPSPSTRAMLHSNDFAKVNLWPRGVDLSQFSPSKRSAELRASWGVGDAPKANATSQLFEHRLEPMRALGKGILPTIHEDSEAGLHYQGRKASLPLTPPQSPAVEPKSVDVSGMDEVISLLPSGPSPTAPNGRGPGEAGAHELPRRAVLLFVGRM